MPRLRQEDGFTLIEVLFSIALLVVGVFAGIGLFAKSQDTVSTAQRTDLATQIAVRELERFRGLAYAKVAVRHDATAPASFGGDDPRSRVQSGMYTGPGGPEPLADPWADPGDQSVPLDYERVAISHGGRVVFARVFRFVSWKDEECPLLDLTELNSSIAQLRDAVRAARDLVGGLDQDLERSLADARTLLGHPLMGTVLQSVEPLIEQADTALGALDAGLAPLEQPLQALLADLEALPVVAGEVDLCDLPSGALPDLSRLATLREALEALDPHLRALTPAVDRTATTLRALKANLSAISTLPSVIASAAVALPADLATISAHSAATLDAVVAGVRAESSLATLDDLVADVDTGVETLPGLLSAPDTPRNIKRVSVAVWLEPSARAVNGVGPLRPVWVSTLVHDPDEGLL